MATTPGRVATLQLNNNAQPTFLKVTLPTKITQAELSH